MSIEVQEARAEIKQGSRDVVRVFVGCAAEHRLAFQVLRYSIRRRSSLPVEVYPLNNADASRPQDQWRDDPLALKYPPIYIPVPSNPKQRAATTFSFQRFLLPELCKDKGRAIYLDSDQILRADIAEMWNAMEGDAQILTTPDWQSAVMVVDCSVGWRIQKMIRQIDAGKRTYGKLMNLHNVGKVANRLDPSWNYMDRYNTEGIGVENAKLIHYTDMRTQPWLRRLHPFGGIWCEELLSGIAEGEISVEDVRGAIKRGDVRPSLALLIGDNPPSPDHAFVYPDDRAKGQGLHR